VAQVATSKNPACNGVVDHANFKFAALFMSGLELPDEVGTILSISIRQFNPFRQRRMPKIKYKGCNLAAPLLGETCFPLPE
jgi:hypothetical protein